jgi:Acetyltransferase (GNAT) domain
MIRVARLEKGDVEEAAAILYDAFGVVYRQRGHVPPFPTRESAAWLCRAYLDLDPAGCVLARAGGEAVGVGFAHPRGPVTSIGPLAARPGAQPGVARALMAELARAGGPATSARLFQDAFNPDSFGLYARLGYVVADVAPYLLAERMTAPGRPPAVRVLRSEDLPAVERYDRARGGADRRADFALLASTGSGFVVEDAQGELIGFLFYRSLPARVVIGPGMAETADTMGDLIDAVAASVPGRAAVIRASGANPAVVLRAFARGFRVDHLGNLMVKGPYRPPPAQLYALFPESL